jgi:hypothetical protein
MTRAPSEWHQHLLCTQLPRCWHLPAVYATVLHRSSFVAWNAAHDI